MKREAVKRTLVHTRLGAAKLKISVTWFLLGRLEAFWRLVAFSTAHPLYYIVGDSHSRTFKGSPFFIVKHIGPSTAHNLVKCETATRSRQQVVALLPLLRTQDWLLLSFGEIDCRVHLSQRCFSQSEQSYTEGPISETVSRYSEFLVQLLNANVNVAVYGVPAAGDLRATGSIPFSGDNSQRVTIHKAFNEYLKEECKRNGISYVDIYSLTCRDDGLLNESHAADEIHLNRKIIGHVRHHLLSAYMHASKRLDLGEAGPAQIDSDTA